MASTIPAPRPARTKRPRGAAPTERPGAVAGISDAAVLKATGRTWEQWLAILDRFDAKKHGHKAAAAHIHQAHDCAPWWSQMVVVAYEQARGLRVKHQTAAGFSVSATRVIAAPISKAFTAVTDPKRRASWLPGVKLESRKATARKYARFLFVSGARLSGEPTPLDMNFVSKGAARCQIAVQHSRLRTKRDAARMKAFWADAADRLKAKLEA